MNQAIRQPIKSLWTIVLAAGASRRLGRSKQLLRKHRRSLLKHSVHLANLASPGRTIVVVGFDAIRIQAHLRRGGDTVRVVKNTNWRDGMGTSLACGVSALPPSASHALVLLTDQPEINTTTIQHMLRILRLHPATATGCHYAGGIGVPAIFPRKLFAQLRALRGDRGARDLLRSGIQVSIVACPEAAIDIDTAADLELLR